MIGSADTDRLARAEKRIHELELKLIRQRGEFDQRMFWRDLILLGVGFVAVVGVIRLAFAVHELRVLYDVMPG